MATVQEVLDKFNNLAKEVGESVEAINGLRAEVLALKDKVGNAEALQAAIDQIAAGLDEQSGKLDAAQNPPAEPPPSE